MAFLGTDGANSFARQNIETLEKISSSIELGRIVETNISTSHFTITGSVTAIGPLSASQRYRFASDINCFIAFGTASSPTTNTGSMLLFNAVPEVFAIISGLQHIGVVTAGGSGKIYITKLENK